jgi:hypothetical protein
MSNMRALILKWYQAHLQHVPRDWEAAVPIRCRKFHCVQHFLRDFMTRNHLSYRCVRAARRCEVRPDEVERFQRELLAAYRDFPRWHIVNADESMWLVLWQPRKAVAEKGVESVKIEVSGDPKAGFTLIRAITARSQRLTSFLVVKGLTPKCHKQFGKNFTEVVDHSKSRWVNQDVFLRFLLFLRQNRGTGPVALVLDQCPAHITPLSYL